MSQTRISGTRISGFTLIELMVAMMLSIFLIGGIVQVFASNKRMFNFQTGVASVQENGRLAMHLLGYQIRQAGYAASSLGLPGGTKALTGCEEGSCNAGVIGDRIEVVYQSAKDCLGVDADKSAGAVKIIGNIFAVKDDFEVRNNANGVPGLFCKGQEVVSNVERMDIQYGVDSNGDLVADSFEDFSSTLDVGKVVTVRVGLLVASGLPVRGEADSTTFNLPGKSWTPADYNTGVAANDKQLRKMFLSTITVRNQVNQGLPPGAKR